MAETACTEANILCEVEEITNPYNFGLQLWIDSKVLDRIDTDHRNNVERQRSEIIKFWYRNTKESERTWERVAEAVKRLGGHRNLETKLRQLHAAATIAGPPTGNSNGVHLPKEKAPTYTAATNQTGQSASTSEMILTFSDDLSPPDLVDWLSQELKAKGLSLNQKSGEKLIEDEINGTAFKDLTEKDLKEMDFKRGPRMNIMKIIAELKGTTENKRMKLTDPDERVEHDDKTDSVPTPHVLCTMEFAPKIDSPPHASNESTAGEGFAPAALPYENRLWRKKVLKVQLKNRHLLSRWRVDLGKFMECANRWSDGIVSKGSNHIPRFEMDDEDPDIVVELNETGQNKSAIGFVEGEGPTVVYLDLRYPDKKYQEHLIVHEFGHVLGLGHEHQRSDFWNWLKDHVDENKMKKDLGGRFSDWERKDDQMDGGATPYDSGSVMHYWCKRSWLTKGYSDREFLDRQSKYLSEGLKAALYGVHERDGNVVTEPSRVDLDFLSTKYGKVLPAKQSTKLESANKEIAPPGSRTVADGEGSNHVNGTTAHGPSPQPDFSQLKEVSSILLDLIRWDGDKKELRIYSMTASRWRTIARKLGLEDRTPGCIENIARRHFYDDGECVRDVFSKWFDNAVGLPNASQFPKSWEGLFNLLTESELGEVAKKLCVALTAADSNARRKQ